MLQELTRNIRREVVKLRLLLQQYGVMTGTAGRTVVLQQLLLLCQLGISHFSQSSPATKALIAA